MYKKLIFDSDALIKLISAGLPREVFNYFKAYISEEVYSESVIDGKKGLYDEAYEIESLVRDNKIFKKKTKPNSRAIKLLKEFNFGRGEESSIHLFFNIKADAIVSDDKQFLNFLFNNNVPFMMPVDIIVNLHKKSVMDKSIALKVLERLRPFIREKYYTEAKKQIGG